MTADLSTLLSRVESGSGADRETDIEIATTLGGFVLARRGRDHKAWLYPVGKDYGRLDPQSPGANGWVRYTTDLNAVVVLVEARLPGWRWMVRRMEPQPGAPSQYAAYVQNTEDGLYCWRAASIAARALLAALIRAEMEKVK